MSGATPNPLLVDGMIEAVAAVRCVLNGGEAPVLVTPSALRALCRLTIDALNLTARVMEVEDLEEQKALADRWLTAVHEGATLIAYQAELGDVRE